ncbi:hypothetical protein M501DRAFT_853359 [Patellaria atrata CBS 101060]|uniref:LIM zinc-binding domain-containing protein n=1 Tax=Patellaria atrata CBS 101060 TaxID=1346257 RepID=A0A9P4S8M5_9PEZI|nr:hypothetical protein M501DRAFT_853359 [Patellaria atrata CBS 101060]
MSDTMRPASVLPAIKCSDCGAEIEIALMGEHICAPQSTAKTTTSRWNFAKTATLANGFLNSARPTPPPRIDSSAANKPFTSDEQLTPASSSSNYSKTLSPSPMFSTYAQKSPKPGALPKSAKDQRPLSPPSPDLPSNLDCAFPPFPTASRSGTPAGMKSRPKDKPERLGTPLNYNQLDSSLAPVSPRMTGGESVMRRMNTIAPGPFDRRREKMLEGKGSEELGHKRTPTLKSIQDRSGTGHIQRPSTASELSRSSTYAAGTREYPRKSSKDNIDFDKDKLGLPNPRPGPPPRPVRTDSIDGFIQQLQDEGRRLSPEPLNSDGRSRTFPQRKESSDEVARPLPAARRPSEPSSESRLTIDEALSSSLPSPKYGTSLGSKASFPNLLSIRKSSQNSSGDRSKPLPAPAPLHVQQLRTFHNPTGSASSDDSSYVSDARSFSSVSTPPPSESSSLGRRPSRPNFDTSPQKLKESEKANSALLTDLLSLPANINRKNTPEPLVQPPQIRAFSEVPESPMDPAIQRGLFSQRRPSRDAVPPIPRMSEKRTISSVPEQPAIPAVPTAPKQLPTPPPEPARSLTPKAADSLNRRPTTARAKCRGCNEVIIGKSVKAADGRLTGRYHKQCFVCKTCRQPFATADFYVINNFPYCGQHYHQLNGSLCQSCNTGIEGPYLETDHKQKFHPNCFSCSQCRKVLSDDYYEIGGRPFCERHAFAAASRNNYPGAGRRNMERRTTRLMMM